MGNTLEQARAAMQALGAIVARLEADSAEQRNARLDQVDGKLHGWVGGGGEASARLAAMVEDCVVQVHRNTRHLADLENCVAKLAARVAYVEAELRQQGKRTEGE